MNTQMSKIFFVFNFRPINNTTRGTTSKHVKKVIFSNFMGTTLETRTSTLSNRFFVYPKYFLTRNGKKEYLKAKFHRVNALLFSFPT